MPAAKATLFSVSEDYPSDIAQNYYSGSWLVHSRANPLNFHTAKTSFLVCIKSSNVLFKYQQWRCDCFLFVSEAAGSTPREILTTFELWKRTNVKRGAAGWRHV